MALLARRAVSPIDRDTIIIIFASINGAIFLLLVGYVLVRLCQKRRDTRFAKCTEKQEHELQSSEDLQLPKRDYIDSAISRDASARAQYEVLAQSRREQNGTVGMAISPEAKLQTDGREIGLSQNIATRETTRPYQQGALCDVSLTASSAKVESLRASTGRVKSASLIMTRDAAGINSPALPRPSLRKRSMTSPGPAPVASLPPLPRGMNENSRQPDQDQGQRPSIWSNTLQEHDTSRGNPKQTLCACTVDSASPASPKIDHSSSESATQTKRLSKHKRQSAVIVPKSSRMSLRLSRASSKSQVCQSATEVSESGSPSKRQKRSTMEEHDESSPSRSEVSDAFTDDSLSRWISASPARKPSILRGSPGSKGSRKGHKRQNCVRISTRSPKILGFARSKSSLLGEISEELPLTGPIGQERIILQQLRPHLEPASKHDASPRSLFEPVKLRASLTPSSPTLTFTRFEQDQRFSSRLRSTIERMSLTSLQPSRHSKSSLLSIPSLPSVHSSFAVKDPVPTPTFELTRPSGEFGDRTSFPFEFDSSYKIEGFAEDSSDDHDEHGEFEQEDDQQYWTPFDDAISDAMSPDLETAQEAWNPRMSEISIIAPASETSARSMSYPFDDGPMELCSDPIEAGPAISYHRIPTKMIPSKADIIQAYLGNKENEVPRSQEIAQSVDTQPQAVTNAHVASSTASVPSYAQALATPPRIRDARSVRDPLSPLGTIGSAASSTQRPTLPPRATTGVASPRAEKSKDLRRSIIQLRRWNSDVQATADQMSESRRYMGLGREASIPLPVHFGGLEEHSSARCTPGNTVSQSPRSARNTPSRTIAVREDLDAARASSRSPSPPRKTPGSTKGHKRRPTDLISSPVSSLRSFVEDTILQETQSASNKGTPQPRSARGSPTKSTSLSRSTSAWDMHDPWADAENTAPPPLGSPTPAALAIKAAITVQPPSTPRRKNNGKRSANTKEGSIRTPAKGEKQYTFAELEKLMGLTPTGFVPETPEDKRTGVVGVEISPGKMLFTPKSMRSLYDVDGFLNEVPA